MIPTFILLLTQQAASQPPRISISEASSLVWADVDGDERLNPPDVIVGGGDNGQTDERCTLACLGNGRLFHFTEASLRRPSP